MSTTTVNIPATGYGYFTQYNNVCQGDPIVRVHRSKDAACAFCKRQNGPIENDCYSHSYSVKIYRNGEVIGSVDYRSGEEMYYDED